MKKGLKILLTTLSALMLLVSTVAFASENSLVLKSPVNCTYDSVTGLSYRAVFENNRINIQRWGYSLDKEKNNEGYATVGRTNNISDYGKLEGFFVSIHEGVNTPYAITNKTWVKNPYNVVTPLSLEKRNMGSVRLVTAVKNKEIILYQTSQKSIENGKYKVVKEDSGKINIERRVGSVKFDGKDDFDGNNDTWAKLGGIANNSSFGNSIVGLLVVNDIPYAVIENYRGVRSIVTPTSIAQVKIGQTRGLTKVGECAAVQ